MRVTVCELRSSAVEEDWPALVEHVRAQRSELVLLPELGLAPWVARTRPYAEQAWQDAVAAHDAWVGRAHADLAPAAVLGTRPTAQRRNVAYAGREHPTVHAKAHLPDEEDFWEASWYGAGDPRDFGTVEVAGARVGFLICTELWFFHHARDYAEQGIHLLAVPRCTPSESLDKWLAGGRAAAVVSGAFCLSSNHGDERFGGLGWIVGPDGDVLATTSRDEPFVTVDVDLAEAETAKGTYPRYVDRSASSASAWTPARKAPADR